MIYETHRPHIPHAKKQPLFGLVEKMFYYYPKIVEAVEEARKEQGYYQSCGKDNGGGAHAFISDPTATLAIKRYSPIPQIKIAAYRGNDSVIRQPEKWIRVVQETLTHFRTADPQVCDVLERKYFKGECIADTCDKLGINHDRYYRLRDAGVRHARECAIQLGIIKVF